MNLARHKGYATVENAKKKLINVIGDLDTVKVHWVIAVNEEGRFVPCVIGSQHSQLVHAGLTVLGG